MKSLYAIGSAAVLGLVAALWFSGSEDAGDASPVAMNANGDDARGTGGSVAEASQQMESRQGSTLPAEGPGSELDTGDGSAGAAGSTDKPAAGIKQVALSAAAETASGSRFPDKSSPTSEIDKSRCEAAVKVLTDSQAIFDVTPTQAIWYARPRVIDSTTPGQGFIVLQARLLASLCSGTEAFSQDYAPVSEFVAISPDSHVRILLGDHWISDGTVVSQLSQPEQEWFGIALQSRRRPGAGPNTSRETFEKMLAKDPQHWLRDR
jgi:hypothetical protein